MSLPLSTLANFLGGLYPDPSPSPSKSVQQVCCVFFSFIAQAAKLPHLSLPPPRYTKSCLFFFCFPKLSLLNSPLLVPPCPRALPPSLLLFLPSSIVGQDDLVSLFFPLAFFSRRSLFFWFSQLGIFVAACRPYASPQF